MTSVKSDSALVELGGARKERPGKAKLQSVSEGGVRKVEHNITGKEWQRALYKITGSSHFYWFVPHLPEAPKREEACLVAQQQVTIQRVAHEAILEAQTIVAKAEELIEDQEAADAEITVENQHRKVLDSVGLRWDYMSIEQSKNHVFFSLQQQTRMTLLFSNRSSQRNR